LVSVSSVRVCLCVKSGLSGFGVTDKEADASKGRSFTVEQVKEKTDFCKKFFDRFGRLDFNASKQSILILFAGKFRYRNCSTRMSNPIPISVSSFYLLPSFILNKAPGAPGAPVLRLPNLQLQQRQRCCSLERFS
jgi:hypothetical protein